MGFLNQKKRSPYYDMEIGWNWGIFNGLLDVVVVLGFMMDKGEYGSWTDFIINLISWFSFHYCLVRLGIYFVGGLKGMRGFWKEIQERKKELKKEKEDEEDRKFKTWLIKSGKDEKRIRLMMLDRKEKRWEEKCDIREKELEKEYSWKQRTKNKIDEFLWG